MSGIKKNYIFFGARIPTQVIFPQNLVLDNVFFNCYYFNQIGLYIFGARFLDHVRRFNGVCECECECVQLGRRDTDLVVLYRLICARVLPAY